MKSVKREIVFIIRRGQFYCYKSAIGLVLVYMIFIFFLFLLLMY